MSHSRAIHLVTTYLRSFTLVPVKYAYKNLKPHLVVSLKYYLYSTILNQPSFDQQLLLEDFRQDLLAAIGNEFYQNKHNLLKHFACNHDKDGFYVAYSLIAWEFSDTLNINFDSKHVPQPQFVSPFMTLLDFNHGKPNEVA